MSSILKALKKLDAEKHSADAAGPDLSSTQEATAAPARPWLPLAAGAVLGALLVASFIVWSKAPEQIAPVPATATAVPSTGKAIPVQDPGPPSQPVSAHGSQPQAPSSPAASREAVLPVASSVQATAGDSQVQTEVLPPERHQGAPVAPARKADVRRTPAAVAGDVQTAKSVPLPKPGPAPAVPLPQLNLRVSDIFFQENNSDSMAVVNDLPVMEGTKIEGAIVEKILVDRIIFRVGSQRHEVLLD